MHVTGCEPATHVEKLTTTAWWLWDGIDYATPAIPWSARNHTVTLEKHHIGGKVKDKISGFTEGFTEFHG